MNILSVHVPLAFLGGMVINVLIFSWTHSFWSEKIHQVAVDSMAGAGWAGVIAWWVVDGAYAVTIMGVIGVALTWAFLSLVIDFIERNFGSGW